MRPEALIAHYVRHGDAKCEQCNDGFIERWVRRRPAAG